MSSAPPLAPHTAVVKTALDAIATPTQPLGVYVGGGPPDPHTMVPYCVLYPYAAQYDGPVADIHADVDYRAQVTSVGGTPEQAEDTADRVRARLLDPAGVTAPAGRSLAGPVRCEPLQGAVRDDDARLVSPLWTVNDLYVLPTTPG